MKPDIAAIRERPFETLCKLLEEVGAVPVICGIPMDAPDARERIAALLEELEKSDERP